MHPPARIPKAIAALFGVLALLVASAGTVGATPPERDGAIHQSLPIAADSFQSEKDCGPITEGTAWHFVLTNSTVDTAGSILTATFQDAGTVTGGVYKISGGATHYYVGTATSDVLTGASVSTGDGQLQLSHVCAATLVEDDEEEEETPATPIVCEDDETPIYGEDGEVERCEPASTGGDDEENGGDTGADKVTLCHATGSESNPYVIITVAKQAVLNGHGGDWHQDGRDIIPPFEGFDGLNTDKLHLIDQGCEVDDGTGPGDEPADMTVGVAAVDAVCIAEDAVITFDLTGDVEDGELTVVLSDDADLEETVEVAFADGKASGSFAYPAEFTGTLVVSVDHDDATDAVTVPAAPDCELDTIVEPGLPVTPEIPTETPESPTETPESPTDIPVELPELPVDVEGDEEVVTDVVTNVPTFTPVAQPRGETVQRTAVLGDTVTRTGQLPRTGTDSALGLAPFGLTLLLAGFALQRSGRRRSTIG